MKPEELKVGMWTACDEAVKRIDEIKAHMAYYVVFQNGGRNGSTSWSIEGLCRNERLATAAEIRKHVPESDWPQWARDNLPNPHATPQGDADGLVWYYWTPKRAFCRLAASIELPGVWVDSIENQIELESPESQIKVSGFVESRRPRWLTPAQLVEIKRLLGVESTPTPAEMET